MGLTLLPRTALPPRPSLLTPHLPPEPRLHHPPTSDLRTPRRHRQLQSTPTVPSSHCNSKLVPKSIPARLGFESQGRNPSEQGSLGGVLGLFG